MEEITCMIPDEGDAEALLAFYSDLLRELPQLHVYPDDELSSVSTLRAYIRHMNAAATSHIVIAKAHEKIVGCVTVEGGHGTESVGTGELGITVRAGYRDRRVGTRLMREMIAWAHGNDRVQRIVLHVDAGNRRAIHVYRGLGFTEVESDTEDNGTGASASMVYMVLDV